jgi:hypothetical protein
MCGRQLESHNALDAETFNIAATDASANSNSGNGRVGSLATAMLLQQLSLHFKGYFRPIVAWSIWPEPDVVVSPLSLTSSIPSSTPTSINSIQQSYCDTIRCAATLMMCSQAVIMLHNSALKRCWQNKNFGAIPTNNDLNELLAVVIGHSTDPFRFGVGRGHPAFSEGDDYVSDITRMLAIPYWPFHIYVVCHAPRIANDIKASSPSAQIESVRPEFREWSIVADELILPPNRLYSIPHLSDSKEYNYLSWYSWWAGQIVS